MIDPIQVLWSPAGESIPNIGEKAVADVTDGDTPNIRMPVRMLSVDTPEVTAKSEAGAQNVDGRFMELARWIREGKAPVTRAFADYILPRLETGRAGTLQFQQGRAASAWFKARVDERLKVPGSDRVRRLFVRTADTPLRRQSSPACLHCSVLQQDGACHAIAARACDLQPRSRRQRLGGALRGVPEHSRRAGLAAVHRGGRRRCGRQARAAWRLQFAAGLRVPHVREIAPDHKEAGGGRGCAGQRAVRVEEPLRRRHARPNAVRAGRVHGCPHAVSHLDLASGRAAGDGRAEPGSIAATGVDVLIPEVGLCIAGPDIAPQ